MREDCFSKYASNIGTECTCARRVGKALMLVISTRFLPVKNLSNHSNEIGTWCMVCVIERKGLGRYQHTAVYCRHVLTHFILTVGLPLQVGDNLIQVDGVVVDTWRLKDLAGLLLGSAGSEVKLSFRNQQGADYEVCQCPDHDHTSVQFLT
jgi:hypothetical protein